MRINQFIAKSSTLSRRNADEAIQSGRVKINGKTAQLSQEVHDTDRVELDGKPVSPHETIVLILHKPVGYVCSRDGQGSKTIYNLLPSEFSILNPIGRLDKDSSGLLLLTNDGDLHQRLSHPSEQKQKVYSVALHKPLTSRDRQHIEKGVELEDGTSKLKLLGEGKTWTVKMHEGRNRQIRRTFAALGHTVKTLHRISMGEFELGGLPAGQYQELDLDS